MNEYKDWIVRFYASHKDIPKGHRDCETLKELVRCKDCRFWPNTLKYLNRLDYMRQSYLHCFEMGGDDFCSKGKEWEE